MFNIDPVIALIITTVVAVIFIYSAYHKLFAATEFKLQLSDYQILPSALLTATSKLLPGLELTGVILFIAVPASEVLGLLILSSLILFYTMAIAINLYRGRHQIDCGCFAAAGRQHRISAWLLWRNMLLLLALALTTLAGTRALVWLDWVTIACASAILLFLYWATERLLLNNSLLKELTT